MNSAFADAFEAGSVRLAPAHLFREDDGFDDGRADRQELISNVQIKGGSETVRSDHPAFSDDMFVFIKGGKRVHFEMTIVGESMQMINNALLFCTSVEIDESLRQSMLSRFGADAVFRIANIEMFGAEISKNAFVSHLSLQAGPVEYTAEVASSLASVGPLNVFEKRAAYAWQAEHRLVWRGEPLPSDAVIVQAPSVISLLERLPDTLLA